MVSLIFFAKRLAYLLIIPNLILQVFLVYPQIDWLNPQVNPTLFGCTFLLIFFFVSHTNTWRNGHSKKQYTFFTRAKIKMDVIYLLKLIDIWKKGFKNHSAPLFKILFSIFFFSALNSIFYLDHKKSHRHTTQHIGSVRV